jgi:hypothetical protein
MQHLSQNQIMALAQPLPMSRDDKLECWAALIERSSDEVFIFHRLEYMSQSDLDRLSHPRSAFAATAGDQVLKEAGLTSDTVGNCMKFFELSKDDVHAFSCDCTGHISTHRMASRIRHLKSSQPPSSSVLSRLMGWFRA